MAIFAFVVIVCLGGDCEQFVMDHSLTVEDCAARGVELSTSHPSVNWSCVIEMRTDTWEL